MLERPNICYIFEKLGVQGFQYDISMCQSYSNSAPAHSTRFHIDQKNSLHHHFR